MRADKPESCQSCPLLDAGSGFVPDELGPGVPPPGRGAIGFFAEAPGEQEVWDRRPLVGKTGRFFHAVILRPLGISRDNVFIGNTIRCRPPKNVFPADPRPVRHCRQYDTSLHEFEPDLVILTYHPAAVFRNRAILPLIRAAVTKALALSWSGKRVLVCLGEHACSLFFPEMRGSGGLRTWHNHILPYRKP